MDPLSAVGLASSILELAQYGCNLVSITSEIYNSSSGDLDSHTELGTVAETVLKFCKEIDSGCINVGDDLTLQSLVSSYTQVAEELKCTLEKVKGKNGKPKSRRESFRQALRSLMKAEDIDKLHNRLQGLRSTINTQILVIMRNEQGEIKAMLQEILDMASSHGANWDRKDTLKSIIYKAVHIQIPEQSSDPENRNMNNEVSLHDLLKELKLCAAYAKTLAQEESILESLRFEGMDNRKYQLNEAFEETYEWILEPDAPMQAAARSCKEVGFVEWLRTSDHNYYIAGKPGSGKSTLVKHIFNHPKTREYLQEWAGNSVLIMASYFFWVNANDLSRSVQGLLQGLLHNILESIPGFAEKVFGSKLHRTMHSGRTWSHRELVDIIQNLPQATSLDLKLCIFVDGLDEHGGDHFELMNLLQKISGHSRIKMCLSSRPWSVFGSKFTPAVGRCFSLSDLNKSDIENYVKQNLQKAAKQFCPDRDSTQLSELIKEVVERAEGVFIWVKLVVHSLREGLANDDSTSILKYRVQKFPTELDAFFQNLIDSVDRAYREIMAKTFLVLLERNSLLLLTLWFLEKPWDYPIHLPPENIPYMDVVNIESEMERRINGRYKGLLGTGSVALEHCFQGADFFHRSVVDFLNRPSMHATLRADAGEGFSAESQLLRLFLAEIKTRPRERLPHPKSDILLRIDHPSDLVIVPEMVRYAHLAELNSGICEYEAFDNLRVCIQAKATLNIESEQGFIFYLVEQGKSTTYIDEFFKRRPDVVSDPDLWLKVKRYLEFGVIGPLYKSSGIILKGFETFLSYGADPSGLSLKAFSPIDIFFASEESNFLAMVERYTAKWNQAKEEELQKESGTPIVEATDSAPVTTKNKKKKNPNKKKKNKQKR